jgi:diacylglycerol kinase family enzyme
LSAALIVNPHASGVTPELILGVERELGASATALSERPLHAVELAAELSARHERIYVFAGDGGYNEVVNGLVRDVPVGFVPGGSTSVLPRALGLPRDPLRAAQVLAGAAAPRRITLGRVNGRRFTFSAGVGLDAELVRRVDALGRGSGRRASDVAFARTLLAILAERRGRLDPSMEVVGVGRVASALVANGDPYSFVGRIPLHVAPVARFEGGLDLVAPRRLRARLLPQVAWWVTAGRGQQRSPHILYVHDADELRVVCDAPTPLQVDGEDLGDVTEATFEAERAALQVLVPR